VGGGGSSSGAAGSGQVTGLPTPGTFSGFDLIFLHRIPFRSFLPLFLQIYFARRP